MKPLPAVERAALIEKYAKRLNDGIILSDKPMTPYEAKVEQLRILSEILTEFAAALSSEPLQKPVAHRKWGAWLTTGKCDCGIYVSPVDSTDAEEAAREICKKLQEWGWFHDSETTDEEELEFAAIIRKHTRRSP